VRKRKRRRVKGQAEEKEKSNLTSLHKTPPRGLTGEGYSKVKKGGNSELSLTGRGERGLV